MTVPTSNRRALCALAILFGTAVLGAQEPVSAAGLLGDDPFLTPIHGRSDASDYGLWAAGADYKASFHDGFTFYPVLGESSPVNLPITWRTTAVQLDGHDLRAGRPQASWTDWRHETRHGPVIERYDVRPDGVEQSFVLEQLPAGLHGDLVVTGRVETTLAPVTTRQPGIAAVGALRFADAAQAPVLEYGAALAFDARGTRVPVTTRMEGSTIELVVPADFVRTATLPLTIDPLIRTISVSSSGGELATCDIARDDETNQLVVVYSRANSGSDHDMWARVLGDDLSSRGSIFYDVTSRWSNEHGSAAFVGGADRLAIAHERVFLDASAVCVYLHPRTSTTANAGSIALLSPPGNHSDRWPTLGGVPAFNGSKLAFVGFRRDYTPTRVVETPHSQIRGAVLDCTTGNFVHRDIAIATTTTADREHPCITREHGPGTNGNWLMVWQERTDRAGEPWRIRGLQVRADGSVGIVRSFGSTAGGVMNLRPKVAGNDGRYAIFWTDRVNTGYYLGGRGHRIRMQQVRWNDGQSVGVAGAPRTVVSDSYAAFDLGEGRAAAYDHRTRSHWGVGWRHAAHGTELARVGYDAGIAERVVVMPDHQYYGKGAHPAVCFDDDHRRFPVVWRTDGSLKAVRATALAYPTDAIARGYGSACRGTLTARNESTSRPYAGSQYFELHFRRGQPNTGATLFAATSPAATPIPLPLSSGCFLLLDPNGPMFPVHSGTPDAAGDWDIPMPLPSTASSIDVFWQVIQFGPSGLSSSHGLETAIR